MDKMYLGTYSKDGAEGIYLANGANITLKARLRDASWLTKTQDGFLLSVSELTGEDGEVEGEMIVYHIGNGGDLTETGRIGTGGLAPCHIAYSDATRRGVISNYLTGNITTFTLSEGGIPLHEDTALLAQADEPPGHAHFAAFLQCGERYFVCDLGLDAIILRSKEKELTRFRLPQGSGPRHLALSSDERLLYVICERSCEVMVLGAETGEIYSRHALHDPAHRGFSAAAAIRLHPHGHMLAASLRGNDKVILFGLDGNGMISWRKDYALSPALPRDIAFSPDGNRLYVALQDGKKVICYRALEQGELREEAQLQCPAVVSLCMCSGG